MSYNTNNVWIVSAYGFIDYTRTRFLNSQLSPTYKILAEGDSWFHIGGHTGVGNVRNLIDGMSFGDHHTLVCNMALSGDTMSNMSSNISSPEFFKFLKTYQWDGLVLSAGGNDLIDALIAESGYKYRNTTLSIIQPCVSPSSYMDHINQQHLSLFCIAVTEHYQRFIDYKNNTVNKYKPVFIHVYDYPTPRNAPAKLFEYFKKGPWVYKALSKMQVDLRFWQEISDYIFDQLAITILQFDGQNHISVINTRNTLTRANAGDKGNSNDWLNEIHPNKDGIAKLCNKINAKLNNIYI